MAAIGYTVEGCWCLRIPERGGLEEVRQKWESG